MALYRFDRCTSSRKLFYKLFKNTISMKEAFTGQIQEKDIALITERPNIRGTSNRQTRRQKQNDNRE